ncbi:MAG: hypothetical protein M1837_002882 [Sclerophora amabilis]|nr:MAG: hypothetical protein M1837_002882 [Sclerophora amabilis]
MAVPTQFAYRKVIFVAVFIRPAAATSLGPHLNIVDASVGHVISTLPTENVYELGFSPRGSFVITWERTSKDEEGNAVKNLKVWRVIEESGSGENLAPHDRTVVGKFVQKSQTGWNLQYTSDEEYCARVVTNEVQFYKSGDLGTGQPAAVKVFNVPDFGSPVSQKTFFKGDKVQLKWNELGTSLIVLAQTEVDKTGKSYYGETNLYILSANGGFDSRIELDKEGPIHDVAWSPNSKEFGVVYGYMPAKTTIFNSKAIATHSFALKPRNTMLFSPHGRFVLVAGFGNLAGQMDIYDLEKDNQKICTIEASNASVCEWSHDGRYILTATTSPRLRVDNGVRIWHVGGALLYNEELTELYHVCWRPQPTNFDQPGNPLHPLPTPHASALAYLGTAKTPSKPAGAYRPPGARGQVTPLHFRREDEGGAAFISNGTSNSGINGFGKPKRREVPGAEAASERLPPGAAPGGGVSLAGTTEGEEALSKAALKNKKKREAKKAKDAAEKSAGLPDPAYAGSDGRVPIAGNRSPERRDRKGHSRSRSHNDGPPRDQSKRRDNREGSRTRGNPNRPDRNVNGGSTASNAAIPSNASASAPNKTVPQLLTRPKQADEAPSNGNMNGAAAASDAPDLTVTSPGGGSPHEKRLRGLLKKQRAIDDLKMRVAGGEKLEDTQMKKIGTEDGVRKELEALGWNG